MSGHTPRTCCAPTCNLTHAVPRCSYALLGCITAILLMRPIVPWTYKKNGKEGDFRFNHVRVREYAESIA